MFTNILVPLDGTVVSEAALPYAEALAARTAARLTLVRSVRAVSFVDTGMAQQRAIADAETYLGALARQLSERGQDVQIATPYGLSAVSWIVEEVGLRNADLVVIATHDRVGRDRWLHGSVAEAVIHRSPVPVLVVRAAEGLRPVSLFDRRRPTVVVPLDGSTLAEAALPVAREVAATLGARIVLVGVVPAEGVAVAGDAGAIVTYAGAEHERLEADAHAYLLAAAERLPVASVVVREGKPSTQIADLAALKGATLIVMATHGRTGLARTILGSVAGDVVRQAVCPVMLVRPSGIGKSAPPSEAASPMTSSTI
jgi:nucleotide-binding universal stress UspA family protein